MNGHVTFEYFSNLSPMTEGVSSRSEAILQHAKEAYAHFTKPINTRRPTNGEFSLTTLSVSLQGIAERCRTPGWDGYDASPISDRAIISALEFLSTNLGKLEIPEATPEPDGELALEWYGKAGAVFSMSFDDQNKINYAGLFSDEDRVHGSTKNFNEATRLAAHFISKLNQSGDCIP